MSRLVNAPPRIMVGATTGDPGVAGYVPTPGAGNETTEFLRKDGTFAVPAGTGGGGSAPGYAASSNSSGNTTITVAAGRGTHLEITTVSGSGSTTRIFILSTAATPSTGAVLTHRCVMPATAAITLEWRNATSGGALRTSFLSSDSGDDINARFYWDGVAWQFLDFTSPANA